MITKIKIKRKKGIIQKKTAQTQKDSHLYNTIDNQPPQAPNQKTRGYATYYHKTICQDMYIYLCKTN